MASHEKLSISLPKDLLDYVDAYRSEHDFASRSEVVARAVKALRAEQLIASYQQAAREKLDSLIEVDVDWGLERSTEDDW